MRATSSMIIAASIAAAGPAAAAVETVATGGVSFATTPFTYDFGGGNSLTISNTGDFFSPEGISTAGGLTVGSLGAPFYTSAQPTAYFTNRGGSFGPGGELPMFASFASPTAVAYSISEGLVGFRFDLGSGFQYGYVDTAGTSVKGLRFETTPDTAVAFNTVPEPASWALMIAGFVMTGVAARRRGPAQALLA